MWVLKVEFKSRGRAKWLYQITEIFLEFFLNNINFLFLSSTPIIFKLIKNINLITIQILHLILFIIIFKLIKNINLITI